MLVKGATESSIRKIEQIKCHIFVILSVRPIYFTTNRFFCAKPCFMENFIHSISILVHTITANFCTCYDSTVVQRFVVIRMLNCGWDKKNPSNLNYSGKNCQFWKFPYKNAFQNIVCKMSTILFRPQYINYLLLLPIHSSVPRSPHVNGIQANCQKELCN